MRTRIFDSARWTGYQPRPDDIVVATFPKCGTTWTQRILGMLLASDAAPAPISVPWFDFRLRGPVEPMLDEANAVASRRQLKSHRPTTTPCQFMKASSSSTWHATVAMRR